MTHQNLFSVCEKKKIIHFLNGRGIFRFKHKTLERRIEEIFQKFLEAAEQQPVSWNLMFLHIMRLGVKYSISATAGREGGTSAAICIVLHREPVISRAPVFDPSGSSCLRAHYSSIVTLAVSATELQPPGRYVSKPSQNRLGRTAFPCSPLNTFACFILPFRDPSSFHAFLYGFRKCFLNLALILYSLISE